MELPAYAKSVFFALSLTSNAAAETVTTTDGRKIELRKDGTYETLGPAKKSQSSDAMSDAGGGFRYGKVKCSVSMGIVVECITRVVGDKSCTMATFTMDLLGKDDSPIGQGNCILSNALPGRAVVLNCQSHGAVAPDSVALHFANCI